MVWYFEPVHPCTINQHVRRPKVRRQSDVAAKAQKQQHAQDGHRGTASAGKPIGTPPAH
eukprot:CAMPEP_0202371938 /NCGR_PEP_ID=MMETSP1127-20130417/3251_1 /ASSEMBLY_ACC=CAM_ASM_000462 /TAXON_ID=3047 /ORGANISM="Dunaliella tertiolecta, Strain CCMP1320" /LENGTH=58 /DNA_ID=CAMNT_0048968349 /DNA_START=110 /DNA_END=283 /DNA_ORIENTATION=+